MAGGTLERQGANAGLPSKVWLYLMFSATDEDRHGALSLSQRYTNSADKIVAEVAQRIVFNQGSFVKETL